MQFTAFSPVRDSRENPCCLSFSQLNAYSQEIVKGGVKGQRNGHSSNLAGHDQGPPYIPSWLPLVF
jgi:hypothetical protein